MSDDVSPNSTDADRLEEEWEHALDVADEAVSASARSKALGPSEVAAKGDQIRSERGWLRRFSPALHRLFPKRR